MPNLIQPYLQFLKTFIHIDPELYEFKLPFTCSFLAIYSFLLITDGYFFLVFLFVGFALGAFYFNNNDGILTMNYEKNLVYSESTLEEVKKKIIKEFLKLCIHLYKKKKV